MELKGAFRYQNFLTKLLREAGSSITYREHCIKVTKQHLRSKVNPAAEDKTEEVDAGDFFPNDDVIRFMSRIVAEREMLTHAIDTAKATIAFDLDAAIETNKCRQEVMRGISTMLNYKPAKRTERGTDYTFNNEGNQIEYFYDVEVEEKEAFDRRNAKKILRELRSHADETSTAIDKAMVETSVNYEPPFDVNDSFEDVMTAFLEAEEAEK